MKFRLLLLPCVAMLTLGFTHTSEAQEQACCGITGGVDAVFVQPRFDDNVAFTLQDQGGGGNLAAKKPERDPLSE